VPRASQPVDPKESLLHLFGSALRHWREDARGTGLRDLAAQTLVDYSQLSKWERGDRPAPEDAVARIDEALGAGSYLVALHAAVTELEKLRGGRRSGDHTHDGSLEEEMDQTRRRLLHSLSALGAASASAAALQQVRQALDSAIPGTFHAVDDWEEVAADYGHAFLTTPAAELLPDLAADVATLQEAIRTSGHDTARRLCRPGGQLAMTVALTLGCLGERREARHWWQTARHTADHSGDLALRVWVRGYEAMHALYASRPLHAVISRADEAITIAGGTRCPAVLEAMAARAQALALLGQAGEAEQMLHAMDPVYEAQPRISAYDRYSALAWPDTAMLHTRSYVYTYTGNPAAAQAQEAALDRYPPQMPRQATQIKLLQAVSLVRAGHICEGVEHARAAVTALPAAHRTMGVEKSARDVLGHVPETEAERSAVTGLREYLALPVDR
jgi:transcriptional regulator with XRE-family HTH domain